MENNTVYLKDIDWPCFGTSTPVITPSWQELEQRIARCRQMMQARDLTHLVVYADREHFANLMYLTHFDPRFEEAILIINRTDHPLLLVGNECVGHLTVSPLYNDGKLRYERYQPLSLISQPRNESRTLQAIFDAEGIKKTSRVGCIGWKYYTDIEFANPQHAIEIPSIIVDTLRSTCGYTNVVNATDMLMSPVYGLKSSCSPFEIAHFEFSNIMASEGMKNLLTNFEADITDFQLAAKYNYTGYPLNCHIGLKSSGNQHIGLSSPLGAKIKRGEPCSTNIAYWGSNICRAGWVAVSEDDLPASAKGYVANFAAPYFYACAQWYEHMCIGTRGKVLRELIDRLLPFDQFGVFLNPGHLIHEDEWVSSPIYTDSEDEIKSGMYFQVDIIPRSKNYFSSRMEDGIVIADAQLQADLKAQYPETYARCMARRQFMIDVLGLNLPDEILPLSNIPAIVPPFFLNHKKILTLKP